MTRSVRRAATILATALLFLLAASVVFAQETSLGGKLRAGDVITVPTSETVEGDLYAFAGTVTMDGTVDGDLVAFGGTVQVNGSVSGDVLTSGGTVSIAGTVDGDVRTAGGQVTVSGSVGEDLLAAGGQGTLSSGASVGGDVIVAGGTVSIDGAVAGSIEGSAGTYSRSGSVGGTENVVVAPRGEEAAAAGYVVLDAIRHFIVLVVLGAMALWLVPRALRAADATLRQRPLLALGGGLATVIGYVVLVVVSVVVMVLLAIVFGLLRLGALVAIEIVSGVLAVGIITFAFVLAVAFVTDIVVGISLARLVAPGRIGHRWQEMGLLAAGAAAVVILTSLPIVGGWAKLAVVLFGLGALSGAAFRAWRSRRTQPAPARPLP